MRPELLGDPEYRGAIQAALNGYFSVSWSTIRTRCTEWDALKVVLRGKSLGKSCGIRKKLELKLMQQEGALAALQFRMATRDIFEAGCHEVHTRIGAIWNSLNIYVRRVYRQRLYREEDLSGAC
ncbi:hypothetical protein NDU88_009859 [Pleurodeles waltl]|uniref:Uncharacterized protein n=1 Tax=Pleurodeles waltl TaxID=8319 RepID=A0AAV7S0X5_PLEWA|nr:hypothetical protein NDU88_009859 [Pleurodeles waltl]